MRSASADYLTTESTENSKNKDQGIWASRMGIIDASLLPFGRLTFEVGGLQEKDKQSFYSVLSVTSVVKMFPVLWLSP